MIDEGFEDEEVASGLEKFDDDFTTALPVDDEV